MIREELQALSDSQELSQETVEINHSFATYLGFILHGGYYCLPEPGQEILPERKRKWAETIPAADWRPDLEKNWGQLMRVVEKVESEGYRFQLCRKRATLIFDNSGWQGLGIKSETKHRAAYDLAVVIMIDRKILV